jgi:hypothetical protein
MIDKENDLSQTKPRDYATMLECLDDRRVVSFTIMESGKLRIMEECDMYFEEHLNKKQAQQLVDELQSLVDKMG